MTWTPGTSGNAAGRPPKAGSRAALRAAIDEHMPVVITRLVELGKAGDVAALKTLADKGLANAKPETRIELPELASALTPSDKAAVIVRAVACGVISVEAGAQLLAALGSAVSIDEHTALAARVAALEGSKFC